MFLVKAYTVMGGELTYRFTTFLVAFAKYEELTNDENSGKYLKVEILQRIVETEW